MDTSFFLNGSQQTLLKHNNPCNFFPTILNHLQYTCCVTRLYTVVGIILSSVEDSPPMCVQQTEFLHPLIKSEKPQHLGEYLIHFGNELQNTFRSLLSLYDE